MGFVISGNMDFEFYLSIIDDSWLQGSLDSIFYFGYMSIIFGIISKYHELNCQMEYVDGRHKEMCFA